VHWLPWWAYPAACCFLAGGTCGWFVGYAHREFVEWGRRYGRLLAWNRAHRGSWRGWRPGRLLAREYREAWRDALRLSAWGADAVARVNARQAGR
jgi:membrane protein YqaA with SNARE-associated domain